MSVPRGFSITSTETGLHVPKTPVVRGVYAQDSHRSMSRAAAADGTIHVMVVRMSIDERRTEARLAARELLAAGSTVDRLTLRMVAEEADMPLPTLNYAYSSIGDLLADLRTEFEAEVAAAQVAIGDGGLATELLGMIESYVDILAREPSNIEILRWQLLLIARGEIVIAGGLSMQGCLRRIQTQAGEQWELPLDDLSVLAQSMISGMHVQFFVQGADDVALKAWRRDARLIVDALCRLAAPVRADSPQYRE